MRGICIAVGNSTVKAGLFDGMELLDARQWEHAVWTESGGLSSALDAYGCGSGLPVVLCSVAPGQVTRIREMLAAYSCVQVYDIEPPRGPMPLRYRTPGTLGADRYAAALAAREMSGAPVIVVDCGTALTINVVDVEGYFLGGSISPGFGLALRMLHRGTEQLPELRPSAEVPLIGRDTAASLRSGVLHVLRQGVSASVSAIRKITGPDTPILLTGGEAALLTGGIWDTAERDGMLVLRGCIFYLHCVASS
jgi:type III pantothenate kinase